MIDFNIIFSGLKTLKFTLVGHNPFLTLIYWEGEKVKVKKKTEVSRNFERGSFRGHIYVSVFFFFFFPLCIVMEEIFFAAKGN